ncbi:MAG: ABC transporter ATP-binding protein [Clostridia bacterium]|nr:ABC transporter ATP-binding protein [Clostridia bacterium]
MKNENILEIKGLSKSFGEKKVLAGLDMSVPRGSVFGFIGRNGAGKTTTMKAILGLLKPDGGEIYVDGKAVAYGETPTNSVIGYLPDVPEFYPFMTPVEYLRLCGECGGISSVEISKRTSELLSLVGLEGDADRRIKGFSRGMKQRLGIAQALLHRPKLLICDEPTSALDPIGRREILDILVSVKNETTVLFSTHVLSDVERICDSVAFLEQGTVAMRGSVDELKKLKVAREFAVEASDPSGAEAIAAEFPMAIREGGERLNFVGNDEFMNRVISFIASEGIAITKIERLEPSLGSLFMEVMGK